MTRDLFTILAMLDELERIFSSASLMTTPIEDDYLHEQLERLNVLKVGLNMAL
jgi:hypothetical protein